MAILSSAAAESRPWTVGERVLFRFAFLYFLLYTFPFPVDLIPGLAEPTSKLWNPLVGWLGNGVLGLSQDLSAGRPITGSGDTTWAYVHLLAIFLLAAIGCAVWSALDRRPHHALLAHWARVGCRYYLAASLVTYGLYKVIKSQFPDPRFSWLIHTYGESSPMRLVWTFMGSSLPYNLFTGGGELAAGLLLLWRPTTTLGALLALGVMGHVVALNFSYDIPVKLYSSNLWLFALALVVPDLKRLTRFFVTNRPVEPAERPPHLTPGRWRIAGWVVKAIAVGLIVIPPAVQSLQGYYRWGDGREKPPLYGLYDVTTLIEDGVERPPLLTDDGRWRYLIVEWKELAQVKTMGGEWLNLVFRPDEEAGTIEVGRPAGEGEEAEHETWTFTRPAADRLVLEGELEGHHYSVTLARRDRTDFLLVNRGFHWVNEVPFNR